MYLRAFPQLLNKLVKSKKYRDAYVSAQTRHAIAYQLRVLREQRKWSQADLGEHAKKPQNVISRLENPNYGKVTIQTLLDLAASLNVALLVRFVCFNDFVRATRDLSPEAWEVPTFEEEVSAMQKMLEEAKISQVCSINFNLGQSLYNTFPISRAPINRNLERSGAIASMIGIEQRPAALPALTRAGLQPNDKPHYYENTLN